MYACLSVCLSVCLLTYLKNTSRLSHIFCTCCLWPWLSPPLTIMQSGYFSGFRTWRGVNQPLRVPSFFLPPLLSSVGVGVVPKLWCVRGVKITECNMLCTSGFVDDVMFLHNGTNEPESKFAGWRHQGPSLLSPTASYVIVRLRWQHPTLISDKTCSKVFLTLIAGGCIDRAIRPSFWQVARFYLIPWGRWRVICVAGTYSVVQCTQ